MFSFFRYFVWFSLTFPVWLENAFSFYQVFQSEWEPWIVGTLTACLHIPFPSPSTFIMVPMETDHLTHRMGSKPIQMVCHHWHNIKTWRWWWRKRERNGLCKQDFMERSHCPTPTQKPTKNGLYRFVWRCSHCTETTMPLSTVAICQSWYRCRCRTVWTHH